MLSSLLFVSIVVLVSSTDYFIATDAQPATKTCDNPAGPFCAFSTVLNILTQHDVASSVSLHLTPGVYDLSTDAVELAPEIHEMTLVGTGTSQSDVGILVNPSSSVATNVSVISFSSSPSAPLDLTIRNLDIVQSLARSMFASVLGKSGSVGTLNISNVALRDAPFCTGFIMGNVKFAHLGFHSVSISNWQGGGFVLTDSSSSGATGVTRMVADDIRMDNVNYTCGISFGVSTSVVAVVSNMHLSRVQDGFHGSGIFLKGEGVDLTLTESHFSHCQYASIILHSSKKNLRVRFSEVLFEQSYGYFGGALEFYCEECGVMPESQYAVDVAISDSHFFDLQSQFFGGAGSIQVSQFAGGLIRVSSVRNVYQNNFCQQKGGVWFLSFGGAGLSKIDVEMEDDTYDSNYGRRDAGGVYYIEVNSLADPVLHVNVKNSQFHRNHAGFPELEQGYYDGGVFAISHGFGSHLDIVVDGDKTYFKNNTGQNGGVFHIKSVNSTNSIDLTDGLFLGNRAFDSDCQKICQTGDGGVIFLQAIGPVSDGPSYAIEIEGVSFVENSALRSGGVIAIYEDNTVGSVRVSGHSSFTGNSAQYRGGCFSTYKTDIVIESSQFDGNSVGKNGRYLSEGGVLSSWFGSVVVDQGTSMMKNFAMMVGGAISSKSDSKVSLSGTTISFSENRANTAGGAIAIHDLQGSFDFGSSAWFQQNSAEFGGALFVEVPTKYVGDVQLKSAVSMNSANAAGGGVYFMTGFLSKDRLSSVTDNHAPDGPNYATSPMGVSLNPGGHCTCNEDVENHYVCVLSGIHFEDGYGQALTKPAYSEFELDVTIAGITTHVATYDTQNAQFEMSTDSRLPSDGTAIIKFNGKTVESPLKVTSSVYKDPAWWIALIVVLTVIVCGVLVLVAGTIVVVCVRVRREKHGKYKVILNEGEDEERM